MKVSIANLRKLGGRWSAHREGFSSYSYEGLVDGHLIKVYSRAHLAPQYDGDDDSFEVRWHVLVDGKEYWCIGSFDPVGGIQKWLERNGK